MSHVNAKEEKYANITLKSFLVHPTHREILSTHRGNLTCNIWMAKVSLFKYTFFLHLTKVSHYIFSHNCFVRLISYEWTKRTAGAAGFCSKFITSCHTITKNILAEKFSFSWMHTCTMMYPHKKKNNWQSARLFPFHVHMVAHCCLLNIML